MNINRCGNITDEGLKYLKNLSRGLCLSGNENITDEGLKYLKNIT